MKEHFPIFVHHPNLVFLDNASTTQKPQVVIDCERKFYEQENANVHRGLYSLSAEATQRYESVRQQVADFIGASSSAEIAFTKGTTESINIVANSFLNLVKPGDNVVVTAMEHHANFIPWQQLCERTGAEFRVAPVTARGDLDIETLRTLLDSKTKILALTHVSNVLGAINPIQDIIELAHSKNIPVLVDAAQSVGHLPVHVKEWDVDFLAFSAHKMFGPMGVGVLYAKGSHHHVIRSLNFGGGIVKNVSIEKTDFLEFPKSVEAGTPHVAGVLSLGAAISFLESFDWQDEFFRTQKLAQSFREKVRLHEVARIVGTPHKAGPIVPFVVDGMHAHDVAAFLSDRNIAVRAGHHCAQPLHDVMGEPATVRASFSMYNTELDVVMLVEALRELSISRIDQLYHDIIKQHDQHPYHFSKQNRVVSRQANNPVCGDKFDLYFQVEGETIKSIHFHGFGCAVSKASTSILAKFLEGQTIGSAQQITSLFLMMIDKNKNMMGNAPEEFSAFYAVRQFPERYDCAALSWLATEKFLNSLTQNL